ncbi:MAG TPA: hypothetical protein EYQ24_16640, partial [Bacteroidetes bacterium]|nr:hypothetical protein [Bacteroidota bacterium]
MIRFLFVLPLIVVSVGVEAQPWVTHCNGIPHPSTRTPYTVVSADDQGDCRWRRNDGAQLRTDPEAIQTFMERFNRAQTWLLASGFRPPAYPFRQGEDFQLHIVLAGQGVCFSVREQTVCTSEAPADPFEVRRLRAGDDEANALFLRSDALETDDPDEVLREALTALMRLTLISYEGYAPDGGAPGGWLSTGYAMAFANWWMRRHEDASGLYDLADESLGETITSNAATVGAANLWVNAALRTRHGGWENPDAFATLRIVPEAVERAEQAGEDPLPHVDGVLREHYGLRREEESGLGVALEMFTRFSTRDVWPVMPQVAPDEDLLVVPEGPPVSRRVIGHEPLAVVRIPVSIPRSDDGLQGITITVEDATESLRWGNRHIIQRVLPEDVPTDVFHTNTLNSCPEPGPACEFDLVFVNAHPEDAERTTPATYTVTVQAGRDCTFPEGATGVSYAVSRGTRQERVARMDLDLPESLFGAMTQIEGTFTLETPVDGGRTLRYDLTGALQCTGSGVRLKDVRVHGFMAGDAIASAVSTGPELEIPQYADVG